MSNPTLSETIAELRRLYTEASKRNGDNYSLQVALVEACPALLSAAEQNERYRSALETINGIRNSIVGMQGFNFSEHAYPLVAALNAAGFKGQPYPEARENLGTLIEQNEKLRARLAEVERQRDEYSAKLNDLDTVGLHYDCEVTTRELRELLTEALPYLDAPFQATDGTRWVLIERIRSALGKTGGENG